MFTTKGSKQSKSIPNDSVYLTPQILLSKKERGFFINPCPLKKLPQIYPLSKIFFVHLQIIKKT
jgi:hypothetical protein